MYQILIVVIVKYSKQATSSSHIVNFNTKHDAEVAIKNLGKESDEFNEYVVTRLYE